MADFKVEQTARVRVPKGKAGVQIDDTIDLVSIIVTSGSPEGSYTHDIGSMALDAQSGIPWFKSLDSSPNGWFQIAGITNLATANINGSTLDVTSDTGTNVTLPAATIFTAGVMTAGDKSKMDFIAVTQAVNLDEIESDVTTHQAVIGVPDDQTTMGAYTGSIISDSGDIKTNIQELETYVEGISGGSGLQFAGTWDATTADPTPGMANQTYLRIDTAGTTAVTTVNFGVVTSWALGDWVLKDNLGNVHKLDNTDQISSVQPGSTGSPLVGTVLIPDASTTVMGVIETSTSTEAITGTSIFVAVTPLALRAVAKSFTDTYPSGPTSPGVDIVISHGLAGEVVYEVRESGSNTVVQPGVVVTDNNTLTITHALSTTTDQFTIHVQRVA